MTSTIGEHEARTRVTCNIPARNAAQEKAFKDIINHLQQQREQHIGVTGYTYSAPGTFYGFWWDEASAKWEPDYIILLMVDYQIPLEHPEHTLSEKVAELKTVIRDAFKKYGSEQTEVWVITHPVSRYL